MSSTATTSPNWNLDINRIDWKTIVIIILVILLLLYIFGVFNRKAVIVRPFAQVDEQNQYPLQY